MKISLKFKLVVIVSSLLIFVLVVFNFFNLLKIRELTTENLKRSEDMSRVSHTGRVGSEMYTVIADLIINGYSDQSNKKWEESKQASHKELEEINVDTETEKNDLEVVKKGMDEIINIVEKEIIPEMKNQSKTETVISRADGKIDINRGEILKALEKIKLSLKTEEMESEKILVKTIKDINSFNIISGLIIIIFIGAVILVISSNILKAIIKIKDTSKDLAEGEGDLTIRLDEKSSDEIGEMSKNFNKFLNKVTIIISDITQYSSRVASGSEELSATMEQIDRSLELLGDSSTTTAASIEELASTTETISDNVETLLRDSEETLELARDGGDAVKNTIAEIDKIKRVVKEGTMEVSNLGNKTTEIGEIVVVINDIAAQTNLLALNAAIEAARAGEAGRGFEVVAEEVRKLAEKTSTATKEISKMVKEIQNGTSSVITKMIEVDKEVETGVEKANYTGDALEKIVLKTINLKDMVNLIANSTKEQALASNEIAKQTENVTNNVEENGRAIEQSTESIREIANIAEKLNQIVSQFKINSGYEDKRGIKEKR